jgi:hypothetical protein
MPCSCQLPIPNYPDTVEWGPLVWRCLHGLAERAGLQKDVFMSQYERTEWQAFLKATADVLPCPTCRDHYTEWLQTHPLTPIRTLPYGPEFRDWIRRWLFDLHNDVNARNSKPLFSWDSLSATYGSYDSKDGFYQLSPPLKRAVELSGISYLKYSAWVTILRRLESTLSL